MTPMKPLRFAFIAIAICFTASAQTQSSSGKYQVVENWADLGPGVEWHVTAGVASDAQGLIIPIRRVDPPFFYIKNGKLVKQWGDGLFKYAHGVRVDRNGFLWATDAGDYSVVYKFNKDTGEILMMLGTKGVKGETPTTFNRPADVLVAPNGDIFVADGYGNSRVVKFSKDGKFIKAWGTKGTGPGQFNLPHNLAMDSQGRLLVADRENGRIQIFDQDGNYLDQWKGLGGKPYGLVMGKDDTLYIGDADGGTITVAKDGKVLDVIHDLGRPHQLAIDPAGAIYYADVREGKGIHKIVKK